MSSELKTRLDALKAAFAARVPLRIVTRVYRDRAHIDRADLVKGVYLIAAMGEKNFTNVTGYEAMDGRQSILIAGDIMVDEALDGASVEDAEFEMIEEIKALCRNLPSTLCTMNLVAYQQSGQMEAPYGWVLAQLEYIP